MKIKENTSRTERKEEYKRKNKRQETEKRAQRMTRFRVEEENSEERPQQKAKTLGI